MTNDDGQLLATDIVSLLHSAFENERDVTGWDRQDFLHGFGATREALIYSILFAPNFVEVEGFVILTALGPQPPEGRDGLAARIRKARAKSSNDLELLLSSCNWVEVPFLFSDRRESESEALLLARVIADAWRARLRGLYPQRNFEVRVLPESETGSTIGVGFRELLAP